MQLESLQLGIVFALALSLIELVKWTIRRYTGNGANKGVESRLDTIKSNDMHHIYEEMKVQTGQHNEMIRLLTESVTILKERK